MNFDFEPFSHLGEIKKNLTIEEVRNIFSNSYRSFYKTKKSTVQTDDFFDYGVHVYYSGDLIVKGVEVFLPNSINFKSVDVLGVKFSTAVEALRKIDRSVRVDGYGADFEALGLSLYCPDHEGSENAIIEAVYVTL